MPVTWVLGASGLLGRHTGALAERQGHQVLRSRVPWAAGGEAVLAALRASAVEMLSAAAGDRWNVVWVAGAGVVGTSAEALEAERTVYAAFLAVLGDLLQTSRDLPRSQGALFLASSAGGVYAGSAGAPFTEATPVRALAPYGLVKLAMEADTHAFVAGTGVPGAIGRISNLYGPGQDLEKSQGLISQLARGCLLRAPVSIYVPLDTRRDYLYVVDAAKVVLGAVDRAHSAPAGKTALVKIVASGHSTSIAELLGVFSRLFKRRAPVMLGDSPNRRYQVSDLRVRSLVWTDLDRYSTTPLPTGIGATVEDLAGRVRRGELVARR